MDTRLERALPRPDWTALRALRSDWTALRAPAPHWLIFRAPPPEPGLAVNHRLGFCASAPPLQPLIGQSSQTLPLRPE